MLSRKSIDLLHFLLKEKRNIPLRELSEHFEVSERSIRYEIDKIQKELSEKMDLNSLFLKVNVLLITIQH